MAVTSATPGVSAVLLCAVGPTQCLKSGGNKITYHQEEFRSCSRSLMSVYRGSYYVPGLIPDAGEILVTDQQTKIPVLQELPF